MTDHRIECAYKRGDFCTTGPFAFAVADRQTCSRCGDETEKVNSLTDKNFFAQTAALSARTKSTITPRPCGSCPETQS